MSPQRLFRIVAIAEACSWLGLLIGMFFKYVVVLGPQGVQVMGPIHGVCFIAYVLTCLVVGRDQRWPVGRLTLALISSVPPLMTLWFEIRSERRGWIAPRWSTPQADA
ncbi:MAG: DUF3817 domain-containing protein [Nocardioides sp.]|uniref:DUF3817 domain-containing protein n=1 Tax=Nocardioides sp. TaxID=35761 RepID=UPI0039E5B2E2